MSREHRYDCRRLGEIQRQVWWLNRWWFCHVILTLPTDIRVMSGEHCTGVVSVETERNIVLDGTLAQSK